MFHYSTTQGLPSRERLAPFMDLDGFVPEEGDSPEDFRFSDQLSEKQWENLVTDAHNVQLAIVTAMEMYRDYMQMDLMRRFVAKIPQA